MSAKQLKHYQALARKWSREWARRARSGATRRQITTARKRFVTYSIKTHQAAIELLRSLP